MERADKHKIKQIQVDGSDVESPKIGVDESFDVYSPKNKSHNMSPDSAIDGLDLFDANLDVRSN